MMIFIGPTKLNRDRDGYVVAQFGQFPECEELPPDFTVSVIGWGSQLLASGKTLAELASYVQRRFGKVRLAHGETR